MNNPTEVLIVEIYANYGAEHWAQGKYLVHTHDDVLWTSSVEAVVNCIREALVFLDGEGN
jgi:hypothetical protein